MTAASLFESPDPARSRGTSWLAGGLAVAIEGGVIALLVFGLAAPLLRPPAPSGPDLTAIELPREQPPPPTHHRAPSGHAAPPGARAKVAPVVAMSQPIPRPRPVPAAPIAGQGVAARSGAARSGTGSGAGGVGLGTGSGQGGEGEGAGGNDAEWIGGDIKDSDYPEAARQAEVQGTTRTVITVGTDGRASTCHVTRSSGHAVLDEATCRLVLRRFRFRPARDASGQAVVDEVDYDQEWTLPPPPPPK